MSSAGWGAILLGVVTILTSVMGILLDCRSAKPLTGNGSVAQCGGFYAVLMLVGILFAVVGALLMRGSSSKGAYIGLGR